MDSQTFHDAVSEFEGTWKGKGRVVQSEDGSILAEYLEEFTCQLVRKAPAIVVYQIFQNTKHAEQLTPMHTESGFIKLMLTDGSNISVEAGFSHPFPKGLVTELAKGTFDNGVLKLSSADFCRASESEKPVTKYAREYTLVANDSLHYVQYLHDKPHLRCEMKRV